MQITKKIMVAFFGMALTLGAIGCSASDGLQDGLQDGLSASLAALIQAPVQAWIEATFG